MIHHPKAARRALAAALLLALAAAAGAQTRSIAPHIGVRVVDGSVQVTSTRFVLPSGSGTVHWKLTTPDWWFAAGSVDFGEHASAFRCSVGDGGASMSCTRVGSVRGEVGYRLRLSDGGPLVDLRQPWVYIQLD
jgi:hypothetical protein